MYIHDLIHIDLGVYLARDHEVDPKEETPFQDIALFEYHDAGGNHRDHPGRAHRDKGKDDNNKYVYIVILHTE